VTDHISPKQFHESEGTEDWGVLGDGANAFFRTGSFAAGARFVQAISGFPGIDDHIVDVDLPHDGVTVRLITTRKDYMGMTHRHTEFARQISGAAQNSGPSPTSLQGRRWNGP
jgi:4a-hydroxytetrahydrobiopterin dehydratase